MMTATPVSTSTIFVKDDSNFFIISSFLTLNYLEVGTSPKRLGFT